MAALELLVVLGVTILVCGTLAHRWHVAPPVLLLACGALLGLAPRLRDVGLTPNLMLLVFLPALLYWESINTSLREIRSNLRTIVPLCTVYVIAVAAAVAVAVVGHTLGLPWGPAWVLGAAVGPTDATAIGMIARKLPRQLLTVIRAESLGNDGTALVIFSLAVSITVSGQHFTTPQVIDRFLLSYAGGVAAGLFTAWLSVRARRPLDSPLLENTVSLLTPFTALLIAELIGASGVLAVVACGVAMSQIGPKIIRADARQQAMGFWRVSTFVLNAALFVVVGIQLHAAAHGLGHVTRPIAYAAVGIVPAVVIAMRFAWLYSMPLLARLFSRRTAWRLDSIGTRPRLVIAAAGFRGAVSMAIALSVPATVASGAPFPHRPVIIFVTAGVIVVTLVVQGLLLPVIVHRTRLPADPSVEEELRLADRSATEEALAHLDKVTAELGCESSVADRIRLEYTKHLDVLRNDGRGDGRRAEDSFRQVRLALLSHRRAAVVRLRDEHRIDDTVLRCVQTNLDTEELRLARRDHSE